jgi:DNA-binding transcriptional MerR regulator
MLSIKETAQLLEVSEHTIRYYSDRGLIPHLDRSQNNHRLFDEKSLNWLRGVINLRQSGMSVDSVKHYVDLCMIGDETIPQRLDIILEQKRLAEERLRVAQANVEYLTRKVELYQKSLSEGTKDPLNPNTW